MNPDYTNNYGTYSWPSDETPPSDATQALSGLFATGLILVLCLIAWKLARGKN